MRHRLRIMTGIIAHGYVAAYHHRSLRMNAMPSYVRLPVVLPYLCLRANAFAGTNNGKLI